MLNHAVQETFQLPVRQLGESPAVRRLPNYMLQDVVEEGAHLGGVKTCRRPLPGPKAILHEVGEMAGIHPLRPSFVVGRIRSMLPGAAVEAETGAYRLTAPIPALELAGGERETRWRSLRVIWDAWTWSRDTEIVPPIPTAGGTASLPPKRKLWRKSMLCAAGWADPWDVWRRA